MEHSLLHGLQNCGLIFALGGVLFRLFVLVPVLRTISLPQKEVLLARVNHWIAMAALAASCGGALDVLVQCAEIDNKTIYAGVSWSTFSDYISTTTVGRLAVVKTMLLLLAGILAKRRAGHLLCLPVLLAATVAATLVSHSAALPQGRWSAMVAQIAHIVGAAFWLGMLFHLALTEVHLGSENTGLLSKIVARFSPLALVSFILITLSGIYSALRFIESPRSVLISPYGLTLTLKLLLLGLALVAGFTNWRLIRPRLAAFPDARPKFRRLLEFELSAGVLLMLVAGILGAISPPSEAGAAQLSDRQVAILFSPRLPPARFVDPARFVGAAERTADDLRYAEFTHQWSGVFVILLGLCWFGQALGREKETIFARVWPTLLLPFGCFIAVVADPEVWILRTFSWRETLSDPQVLEHQVGALLVFGLAALGFRDRKRETRLRPLGHAFPIVMICGSLMLLGHAHSNLGISEELSSLINVEHAVIGSLGLVAGLARWFEIRQLPGFRAFRYVWPSTLVMLGIFMAFFYRELTVGSEAPTDPNYSMISRLR